MTEDERTAHILNEDGVAGVRFVRNNDDTWTNTDPIDMTPGATLDFGGMAVTNRLTVTDDGETLEFTYNLELDP